MTGWAHVGDRRAWRLTPRSIKAGIASVTAVVPVVEDSSVDLAAALRPASWPGVPAL